MMTYLAQCGNTTCDKFDPINAKWFKIDEVGKKNNSATWFQQDISTLAFFILHYSLYSIACYPSER